MCGGLRTTSDFFQCHLLFVVAAAVVATMVIAIIVAVVALAAATVTAVIAIVAAMVVAAIVAAAAVGSLGLSLARLAGQSTPGICLFLPSYYWQYKWMPPYPTDLIWVLGVGFRID